MGRENEKRFNLYESIETGLDQICPVPEERGASG